MRYAMLFLILAATEIRYRKHTSICLYRVEIGGLPYSNLSERRSVLAIGECESDGSIINTIGHELLHVVAHICEQDGIDMLSEEPCYMMGSLCEKFFDVSSVNNVN